MIDLRFVFLKDLPGGFRPAGKRRSSTVFSSSYMRTLERLEVELNALHAIDIVVQAGFEIGDIRNDGWPRGKAIPVHPAVVLSFRVAKTVEEYSFPCDTFNTFHHNLHAIAFTLEALRAVNRYGVTRGREQYKGFAQLPEPANSKQWTIDAAAAWLAERSNIPLASILNDRQEFQVAYRIVGRKCHPDMQPEAKHEWQRLQDAKQLIESHFQAEKETLQ